MRVTQQLIDSSDLVHLCVDVDGDATRGLSFVGLAIPPRKSGIDGLTEVRDGKL